MFDTVIESLDQDELTHLRDACNRRLLGMRRTEGLTSTPSYSRAKMAAGCALFVCGRRYSVRQPWKQSEYPCCRTMSCAA